MAFQIPFLVSTGICLLFVSLFVGSLYALPRHIREMDRQNPVQIKARMVAVFVVCLICPIIVAVVLSKRDEIPRLTVGDWIGIRAHGFLPACLLPLFSITILFAGPLVHFYLQYTESGGDFSEPLLELMENFFPNTTPGSLEKIRNLVAAPLAEELIFRCCMGSLMIHSHVGRLVIIFFTPTLFGFAHLHHAYGMIKQGKPYRQALLTVTVQFVYTSLFGSLEMYYFLRTGHLISLVLVHSWCNLLGLPPLAGVLDEFHPNYVHRKTIGTAYIMGIASFVLLLAPLTSPAIYGNQLWKLAAT